VFQKIIYGDFAKDIIGWRSAIGIRVESGGFAILGDIMAGTKESPYYDDWCKGVEEAKVHGVDLSERTTAKGDFSKYDQTLLGILLVFMAVAVIPFIKPPPWMSMQVFKHLLKKCVLDIVYKMCNFYGLNVIVRIWGCMFSGMFVTSVGDTFCLIDLVEMYLNRVLEKYKFDPIVTIVMKYNMVVYYLFGDDHTGSFPNYMNKRLLNEEMHNLMDDFVYYCCTVFGMRYKDEEKGVYESALSCYVYESIGPGMYREVYEYEGPNFIKNAPACVYVDDVYYGVLPHQDSFHIMSKMKVLVASQSIKTSMCLISSLARLCSGNWEVYTQLQMIYDYLKVNNGEPSIDDWKTLIATKQGRNLGEVFRRLDLSESPPPFPSMVEMLRNHTNGYNNKTGFARKEGKFAFDMTPLLKGENYDNVLQDVLHSVADEVMKVYYLHDDDEFYS